METHKDKIDYAYFKGKIVPASEAKINIKTHALQYGTGCFGGIRGYWNENKEQLFIFRLEDHYKRLHNSAKILMMNLKLSIDELINITLEVVRKNNWKESVYIRPFLYKSELSLSPRLHDVQDDIAIYTLPVDKYFDDNEGLHCKVSSWRRVEDNMIPTRAKVTGGYINSALAKSDAILDGYNESIFLDHSGNVSEGSAENIFIVRNGQVITPTLSDSILEGITRRSIIEIMKNELNINVIERSIGRTELYIADEIFLSGTRAQMEWVKKIDNRIIGTGDIGPITKQIQELYFNIVTGNNSKYNHWLTRVY